MCFLSCAANRFNIRLKSKIRYRNMPHSLFTFICSSKKSYISFLSVLSFLSLIDSFSSPWWTRTSTEMHGITCFFNNDNAFITVQCLMVHWCWSPKKNVSIRQSVEEEEKLTIFCWFFGWKILDIWISRHSFIGWEGRRRFFVKYIK